MNNDRFVTHPPEARRWRMTTRAVVGRVLVVWLAAALMVCSLVPQLVANDPTLVGSAADVFTALGIVTLIVCVAGAAILGGLVIVWRSPAHAAGRVIMMLAGLAVAAAISRLLPGESIAGRMMLREPNRVAKPDWGVMLVLTTTLIVAWVALANASLASHTLNPFLSLKFGMPTLAGGILSGWRGADPNRLETLGSASLAGTASSFLFLLTLILGNYYRFNPVGYFLW